MRKLFIVVVVTGMGVVARSQPVGGAVSRVATAGVGTVSAVAGGADTIKEVSVATGWGSRGDSVPRRIDWTRQLSWKKPFPVQSFIFLRR